MVAEESLDSLTDDLGPDEEPYFVSGDTIMTYEKSGLRDIFKVNNQEKQSQPIVASWPPVLNNAISEYTMSDFRKDITSKVTNFLRPNFDQIVLLVGAGGSIVPAKMVDPRRTDDDPSSLFGLPMSKILEAIENSLPKFPKRYFSLEKMIDLSFHDAKSVSTDLESLLSQFEKAEEFMNATNSKKYTRTLDEIRSVIKDKTQYDFNESYMKHLALINFFNKRVAEGNKLSIVTSNYDTVLEEAAAKGNYTIFDGFTFGDKPMFDPKMFDWNLVKDVPNLETKELIYDRKVINLLKIHGSLTWTKGEDGEVRKVSKHNNKSPLLIFPSNNKYEQSYRAPYSDLFYKFRELLNRPRTLLVTVGFSFGDTHIFEMVNDAIRHNDGLSMLFTDYSINWTKSKNLAALRKRAEEGYRVAFLKASLNDDLPGYLELEAND